MNTNGHNYRELANWIKDGWSKPDADKFRHRYLPIENGRYTLSLYTLGFALLGKMGTLKDGVDALKREVDAAHDDPFDAMARFFGVSKSDVKRIGDLEGPFVAMQPTEIAERLERGELYGEDAVRPLRAPLSKR